MANCAQHKTEIEGKDLKQLAIELGDLNYYNLGVFLRDLSNKIGKDSKNDSLHGRTKLALSLMRAAQNINSAAVNIEDAFSISKPFMQ